MSTATITRIDTGKTGTGTIGTETMDWRARADRIAGEIAEAAARHDADDSFVAEGYQRLKEEGFFKALIPAELGGGGAEYAEICDAIAISPRAAARRHSPSRCIRTWSPPPPGAGAIRMRQPTVS